MVTIKMIDQDELSAHLFPQERLRELVKVETGNNGTVTLADGQVLNFRMFEADKKSPNIIYFPDTRLQGVNYNNIGEAFNRQGINFLLTSYSTPAGKEQLCFSDFIELGSGIYSRALEWLHESGFEGKNFVMGKSLGSVLAIDIAFNNSETLAGLFIESGISSTDRFLKNIGCAEALSSLPEGEGFNNLSKIEAIEIPTLIFHGSKDEITPVAEAEKLQASSGARTKQFFVVPGGGQESLSQAGGEIYFETIKTFVNTVCGVNTWRQRRRKHRDE